MTLNDVIEIIPIELVTLKHKLSPFLNRGIIFKGKAKDIFKYFGNKRFRDEINLEYKEPIPMIVKNELIFDFDEMDITEVDCGFYSNVVMDNDKYIIRIKDNKIIDKYYLMAWINLSDNFRVQSEGITSDYYKKLLNIEVDIPTMERQIDVGKLYHITRKRFLNAIKIIENDNDIISNILDEIEYETIW